MHAERRLRCNSCSARLARDNHGTVCSPCRRGQIEAMAKRAALATRDADGARRAFSAGGLRGVASHLLCSADEALEVVVMLGLLPAAYRRRVEILRRLVALDRASHVAAAEALGLSRWTVATYRRDLGLDQTAAAYSRPERSAAAIA
ncbi:MAG: hypothetical protein AB7Q42_18620 [Acidimicrobiia bacterium]